MVVGHHLQKRNKKIEAIGRKKKHDISTVENSTSVYNFSFSSRELT